MSKKFKNRLLAISISSILLVLCIIYFALTINSQTTASQISKEDAETFVNTAFDETAITNTLKAIASKNNITVNDINYGSEKNIILDCTVTTPDVYSVTSPEYDRLMNTDVKKANGTMFKSSLDFKMEFEQEFISLINNASEKTTDLEISIYDTTSGFLLYADDTSTNIVYGGIIDIQNDIKNKTTVNTTDENGNITEKTIQSTNVNKGFIECFETRRISEKPNTAGPLGKFWTKLKRDFTVNFLEYDRWKTVFSGLWVTICLTFFALLIGITIGFMVAFIRCSYLKTSHPGILLKLFNSISQLYLTVIRGTPVVVQIMIIYFVIFMPIGVDKFIAAVICFGLNSGAYVAEIVRGGIMSIDNGQMEAGRSLGFNYMQTMFHIIFPQAFKAVLPSLANEFVVLLKETSIAFYIGLGDLMYAVNSIRAATYSPFMPLIASALIYLAMVLILSKLVSILERRLRNSER